MAKHGDNKQVAASARKARLRNLRLMRAFAFVVILCTAFVAGFAVRSNDALLESLGFTALLESGDSTSGTAASKDKNTYNCAVGARRRGGGRARQRLAWTPTTWTRPP